MKRRLVVWAFNNYKEADITNSTRDLAKISRARGEFSLGKQVFCRPRVN